MKKIIVLIALQILSVAGMCSAQSATQFLTFNDNNGVPDAGTYNPTDSFSFDVYLTFDGYISTGLSFWLETQTLNSFAGSLSITGVTYGTTFPVEGQATPNPAPFNNSSGASPGYQAENRDLGSIDPSFSTEPGTYFVAHVTLSIAAAMPGIYTLQSTIVSPLGSEATSFDGTTFMDNYMPVTTYTITIVPEPSTLALLVIATIGVVATFCRRTFVKKPAA